jgi:hypothetical protein
VPYDAGQYAQVANGITRNVIGGEGRRRVTMARTLMPDVERNSALPHFDYDINPT